MYQDALLAHYRAPQNRRTLADANASGRRKNPLCGDEIVVELRVDAGSIADAGFGGRGCSIATASASMLSGAIVGKSPEDALRLADAVDAMLRGEPVIVPPALEALRGVAPFPARHGCATMPWAAMRDALRDVHA